MAYSHGELHEKATEPKQWMQKECSIKGNRIKSNKNPKAAHKGAAYSGRIYNTVQLLPSQYTFTFLFFFFCFCLTCRSFLKRHPISIQNKIRFSCSLVIRGTKNKLLQFFMAHC